MPTNVGGIFYTVELDTAKLVAGQRQVTSEVDKAAQTFNQITQAVKAYATAMAALKLVERADEFRLLGARIQVASGSIEAGTAAFAALVKIGRETQTSVAANIDVFTRLNQSILQMGGTQADTLRLTDLLAKAIKVSGASATEAKAAMLQFGQALGSGKLAGDEFRSLMENAPYLMRQLADGLGVPIGALKQLSTDGKLTSDVIVNALSGAAAKINEDFKTFPQTFAGAMQVLQDSASIATLKLDELSGSSATSTGIALGAAQAFDKLGEEIGATNEKAGELGRNKAIQTWAEESRVAFSYLIDAADLVWQTLSVLGRNVAFVFKGIGTEIGGIGAQVAAVMRGDFAGARAIGEAMKADAQQRRKELDEADAKTLGRAKLFGQQMREAWNQGAGGGRGFVNPQPAASKLKPPPGVGGDKDKAKFDAEGYLASLNQATLEGLARVDAAEQEALRKNAKLLEEKKINAQQAAQAITLIEQKAADDRLDIQLKNAEGIRDAIEKGGLEEEAARKKIADEQARGRNFAGDLAASDDPIARLQRELEEKSALLAQYAAIDQANLELYAQARVALETETAAKMKEIRDREQENKINQQAANEQLVFAMASSAAGDMLSLLQKAGKDRTAIGKALFLAERALAVATIILNTEVGAAKAIGIAGPFGIPLATLIRATGYGSAAMVGALAVADAFGGGRQYGGGVSSGSMYRVNETGRPEMFTASNGSQYMLPTANGNVTPADQVGGGGAKQPWTINIHQAPPGTSASVDQDGRSIDITIGEAASQIAERRGPMWAALSTTNVQGRF